ncbi:ATP/GTP-binding protein [Hoyosella sp. YIM 151337]|nr:ATP/GTP-binding protein [Hoyosella sp. YIM 151337]
MPRRNTRKSGGRNASAAYRPVSNSSVFGTSVQTGPGAKADDDYAVRTVTGAAATKTYRCPGCDQTIAVGTPHVVAWPISTGGASERRHWHSGCWKARRTRTVTRRW